MTIISVVRLKTMIIFANSENITWDYMDLAWWSTLELHLSIICACLPSLRALFIALGAKVLATTKNASTGRSRSRSGGNDLRSGGSSKLTSSVSEKAPKRGDEGDFIPLVDVEIGHVKPPVDSDSVHRLAPLALNRIRATTHIVHSSSDSDGDSIEGQRPPPGRR